jgi:hypothetical protein
MRARAGKGVLQKRNRADHLLRKIDGWLPAFFEADFRAFVPARFVSFYLWSKSRFYWDFWRFVDGFLWTACGETDGKRGFENHTFFRF